MYIIFTQELVPKWKHIYIHIYIKREMMTHNPLLMKYAFQHIFSKMSWNSVNEVLAMLLKDRKTGTQTNSDKNITCAVEVENSHKIHTQVKKNHTSTNTLPVAECPPFRRRYFQMNFRKWKVIFILIKFHWIVLLGVQLTTTQYWLR